VPHHCPTTALSRRRRTDKLPGLSWSSAGAMGLRCEPTGVSTSSAERGAKAQIELHRFADASGASIHHLVELLAPGLHHAAWRKTGNWAMKGSLSCYGSEQHRAQPTGTGLGVDFKCRALCA
jgi:hypothetical protein